MLKRAARAFAYGLAIGSAGLAAAYFYFVYTPSPDPPASGATIQRGSLQVDRLERSYLAYVPDDLTPHPALVLAFHGSKGDGETMRAYTGYGFERLADEHGFIVVYPEGYERHWNDCRASGPYAANTLDVDDLGFVQALIRRFTESHGVDATRVFATGFSNGGHLAYRLALERPHAVRAVAAVAANLPTPDNLDCTPSGEPVSVMIMNGTADPLNPFEGGEVSLYEFLKRGTVQSSQASAEYFSQLAGADRDAPVRSVIHGSNAEETFERTTWRAPGGTMVRLVAVPGGGHALPQSRYRFPRLLGPTLATLDGPAEIWSFFEQQMRVEVSSREHPAAPISSTSL